MHIPELTETAVLAREMAFAIEPSVAREVDLQKISDISPNKSFRYNSQIGQADIINYCAIHNIGTIIPQKHEATKLGNFTVHYDDILIEYAVTPPEEHFINAAPEIGKWKDLKFDRDGRWSDVTVNHYEAFSGTDMIDLFHHVRVTRPIKRDISATRMPEHTRPETTRALMQALGIPPFISLSNLLDSHLPQILCQETLQLDEWGILNQRDVGSEFFNGEPPWWVAPYLMTPHFSYEITADGTLPAFRVARWIVRTEQGLRNFYMLYAAMRRPPGCSRWLSAWLPAPLPTKLYPFEAPRLETLAQDAAVIVTRDLHVEAPSDIFPQTPYANIRYPASVARISPKHIDWSRLRGRRVYLLLDVASHSVAENILSLYREILLASPKSLEIIWKRPIPLGGEPLLSTHTQWVRIAAKILQGFVSAADRTTSDKISQEQYHQDLRNRSVSNGGRIELIHGAPTIGLTTFAMHTALALSKGLSAYANELSFNQPKRTLFICQRSKESNLQKLSNISPFGLPREFRLLDAGHLTFSAPALAENPEFSVALAWADVVFLDNPQDNQPKGASQWLHIFRMASRLKEEGKLVVILTHSDEIPRLHQFLHHVGGMSRVTDSGTNNPEIRDIINEFTTSPRFPGELNNTRYMLSQNMFGQSLEFIGHPLNDNTALIPKIQTDEGLTRPEKIILLHLLKHGPSALSSIKVPKTSRRTLNNISRRLIGIHLIEMISKGRSARYQISYPYINIRYISFARPSISPAIQTQLLWSNQNPLL